MQTEFAEAQVDLDAACSVTAEWEAELAAAQSEVEAAEADRPRTPQDSASIAQRRVAARERVGVSVDALEGARGAEMGARRAAVTAEAAEMAGPIREAEQALDAYLQRIDALLAPLVELTGHPSWAPTVASTSWDRGATTRVLDSTDTERDLRSEVDRLTRQQSILLRAGVGEELHDVAVADLPASLQVGGVLPDPRAVESDRERHEREAEAAARAARIAADQAEVDAACKTLGVASRPVSEAEFHRVHALAHLENWRTRMQRQHDRLMPAELETVARLCGPEAAEAACAEWVALERKKAEA